MLPSFSLIAMTTIMKCATLFGHLTCVSVNRSMQQQSNGSFHNANVPLIVNETRESVGMHY
jgi:hypothetical protein